MRPIAVLVLAANLLGFAVVPLVALIVRHASYVWTLPLVAVTAGLLGATFPLICHISIEPDARAGAGLSYLYLANIVGSAAGSWLVGFVLMDYLPLRWVSVLLALLGLAVAMALLAAARQAAAAIACAALAALVVLSSGPLFATVYRQMEYKREWRDPGAPPDRRRRDPQRRRHRGRRWRHLRRRRLRRLDDHRRPRDRPSHRARWP